MGFASLLPTPVPIPSSLPDSCACNNPVVHRKVRRLFVVAGMVRMEPIYAGPGRPPRDRVYFLLKGRLLGDKPLRRQLRPTAVSSSSSSISVGTLVDPPVWEKFFLALGGVLRRPEDLEVASKQHMHAWRS